MSGWISRFSAFVGGILGVVAYTEAREDEMTETGCFLSLLVALETRGSCKKETSVGGLQQEAPVFKNELD